MAATPADLVAQACADLGEDVVVDRCVDLLTGRTSDHPFSLDLIAGPGSQRLADRYATQPGKPDHWPRAWAARALRYAWREEVGVRRAVVSGLSDPAWRVRETCAAVVRLREVAEAAEPLRALLADETPRVRVAAAQALAVVGEHDDLEVLATLHDEDARVARAVGQARSRLAERLDLPDPGHHRR